MGNGIIPLAECFCGHDYYRSDYYTLTMKSGERFARSERCNGSKLYGFCRDNGKNLAQKVSVNSLYLHRRLSPAEYSISPKTANVSSMTSLHPSCNIGK